MYFLSHTESLTRDISHEDVTFVATLNLRYKVITQCERFTYFTLVCWLLCMGLGKQWQVSVIIVLSK